MLWTGKSFGIRSRDRSYQLQRFLSPFEGFLLKQSRAFIKFRVFRRVVSKMLDPSCRVPWPVQHMSHLSISPAFPESGRLPLRDSMQIVSFDAKFYACESPSDRLLFR